MRAIVKTAMRPDVLFLQLADHRASFAAQSPATLFRWQPKKLLLHPFCVTARDPDVLHFVGIDHPLKVSRNTHNPPRGFLAALPFGQPQLDAQTHFRFHHPANAVDTSGLIIREKVDDAKTVCPAATRPVALYRFYEFSMACSVDLVVALVDLLAFKREGR